MNEKPNFKLCIYEIVDDNDDEDSGMQSHFWLLVRFSLHESDIESLFILTYTHGQGLKMKIFFCFPKFSKFYRVKKKEIRKSREW